MDLTIQTMFFYEFYPFAVEGHPASVRLNNVFCNTEGMEQMEIKIINLHRGLLIVDVDVDVMMSGLVREWNRWR